MNYQKIYDSLIERAKLSCRKKYKNTDDDFVYYENHHIVPRCQGGGDTKENKVLLTAREHFVVHQLLVKIYKKNRSLWYALYSMSRKNKFHIRNNREYEWIR